MKKLHLLGTLTVALLCVPETSLRGQILTTTDLAYQAVPLFASSPSRIISAIATDGADRIFYLETGGYASPPRGPAQLFSRTVINGLAGPPELLYEFGAVTGNFLEFADGTIYGGEFTNGSLFAINSDGTNYDQLGTVPHNYHGDWKNGSLYVGPVGTVGPGGTDSDITKFELIADPTGGRMLSTGEVILEVDGQTHAGAFEFLANGDLLYAPLDGVYQYSAAEVSVAEAGPMDLRLDPAHLLIEDISVMYLAPGSDNRLWVSAFTGVFEPPTKLQLIDLTTRTVTDIATASTSPASTAHISHLEAVGDTLYVNVIDWPFQRSMVYAVVPEPATPAMLAIALFFARSRRGPRRIAERFSTEASDEDSAACKFGRRTAEFFQQLR